MRTANATPLAFPVIFKADSAAPAFNERAMNAGPDLSIILVTPAGYDLVRKTVHHLSRQTISDRLELIFVTPDAAGFQIPEVDADKLARLHSVRIVQADPAPAVSAARVEGIKVAAAEIVVMAEDHSFPEPGWAAALLAGFTDDRCSVGPIVLNGNPHTALSWANYYACFLHWGEGAAGGVDGQTPWHNSAYRRDALLSFGERLVPLFTAEGLLQEELKAQGQYPYTAVEARTHHVNFSLLAPYLQHAFNGGRLFGFRRAEAERWSAGKRLLHVAASPLVPIVRLKRIVADAGQRRQPRPPLWRILPLLAAGMVLHMAGEVTGLLFGGGDVDRAYSYFELWRSKGVNAADRKALAAE